MVFKPQPLTSVYNMASDPGDADPTTAQATAHPQSDSLLFKLPAEIRNNIYELVVLKAECLSTRWTEDHGRIATSSNRWLEYIPPTALQPELSKTCRVMREKVLSIFYGWNQFTFSSTWHPDHDLVREKRWLL